MSDPSSSNISRRTALGVLGAFALAAPLASACAAGLNDPDAAGARDFDFLLGRWTVRHRKLRKRLAGSHEWDEFPGTLEVRPILGGEGNIDENVLEEPAGRYLASSLRLFDAKTERWSIYWIDGRSPGIDQPVVGRFDNGEGLFYNDDVFDGRRIRVRFIYQSVTPRSARWEQAFSLDGGVTWETNWTMEFNRA